MVSASDAAIIALSVAIAAAIQLFSFPDPQPVAGTAATSAPASASEVLLELAAVGGLFAAIAFTYRHLHHHHRADDGAGNRRLPEVVSFVLCVSAAILQFFLFVHPAAGGVDVDHGDQARALGLAALRVLPAAATATYFLGMSLLIIALVQAAPVRLLTGLALGAAAALVCLMAAVAFYAKY